MACGAFRRGEVFLNGLGFDIGSSGVKAGIVRAGEIVGQIARASFPTHFDSVRAEVKGETVLRAISQGVAELGSAAKKADVIALSVMAPAWVAMDRKGKALSPLVTHQDRRSVDVAIELEKRVGKSRYLKITGNRPFPGGISATTLAWFAKHQPSLIRRAELIGHLNTYLHRQITGARAIDPSNASFTGLYETIKMGGWNQDLCAAAGVSASQLPEIHPSNAVVGHVSAEGARRFGLQNGIPVMAGMIDASGAMFLAPARPGQLLNVCGSTDVLALCTDRPKPHERLLTRALGIGQLWVSVGTLAAAGSALMWIHEQMFRDLAVNDFYRLVTKLANKKSSQNQVIFEPWLAGDRTSIVQKRATFGGLTLSSKREDMLRAVIDALAQSSSQRLALLESRGIAIDHRVMLSGGAAKSLHQVLRRDWPGRWTFRTESEASLRGLSVVPPVQL